MQYFIVINSQISNLNEPSKSIDLKDFKYSQAEPVSVYIVDDEHFTETAPDNLPNKKDEIISSEFLSRYSSDYVVNDLRIDANKYVVVGITKQLIQQLYSIFKTAQEINLFSYGLTGLGIAIEEQKNTAIDAIACIESISEYFLVTFFHKSGYSKTRVISKGNSDLVIEVRRSFQELVSVLQKLNQTLNIDSLKVFTNEEKLSGILVGQFITDKSNFVVNENSYILGNRGTYKSVKQFLLPEILFKKQQKAILAQNMLVYSVATVVFVIAVVLFAGSMTVVLSKKGLVNNLSKVLSNLETEVTNLSNRRYAGYFLNKSNINFGHIVLDFTNTLNPDYFIDSFSIKLINFQEARCEYEIYLKDRNAFYDKVEQSKFSKQFKENNHIYQFIPGKHISYSFISL